MSTTTINTASKAEATRQAGPANALAVRAQAEAKIASVAPRAPEDTSAASLLAHWRAMREWRDAQPDGDQDAAAAALYAVEEMLEAAPCHSLSDIEAKATYLREASVREMDLSLIAAAVLPQITAALGALTKQPAAGPLPTLVAKYRAAIDAFNIRADEGTEGDKLAEKALDDTCTAVLEFQPQNLADIVALIGFFKSEHDDDPTGESYYLGKRPIEHLHMRAQAMPQIGVGPRQDEELISLGQQFADLTRRFDAVDQSDHDGADEAEALTEAMDPIVQRAKRLAATTMAGLRVKADMAARFLPMPGTLESADLCVQLAHGLIDDLQATAIPDTWANIMTVRPNDPALVEVVLRAISQGHLPDEVAQVVYSSPAIPEFAPAIYFEKPDGDLVIVSRSGTQTAYGNARNGYSPDQDHWEGLQRRLHEVHAMERALNQSPAPTDADFAAWENADRALLDEIEATPALGPLGLQVKAAAAVACSGVDQPLEDFDLAGGHENACTDVRLASQIVAALARKAAL